VGTPGGSTIITTVVQILLNRIDLGMTMAEAVAAPRATQRNTAATLAEADFIELYADDLAPYGQGLTQTGEIGAAAAIEVDDDGLMIAVAEPERRGGGTGLVLEPAE
jgi:gamma-glutamyltranspeptidase/glutathione hydrolase